MSSKECFKCLETKPLEAFYRHPRMKDGRLNKCIECTKVDVKNTRLSNIEKYRSYDRERDSLPHRKELHKRVISQWRADHPKRRSAQMVLGYAVKRGEVSPLPCFVCGAKAEAHHPDYDAPLAVSWLCPPHHKQAHALMKELAQ